MFCINTRAQYSLIAILIAVVVGLVMPTPAAAIIVHDESVNGDLGDSHATSTEIEFSKGDNDILAQTGPSATDQFDRFNVVLQDGQRITQIILISYSPGPNNIATAFNLRDPSDGALVDSTALTVALIGSDILPLFEESLTGFFGLSESTGPSSTRLRFVVVPEPASLAMFVIGLAGFGVLMRRRKRQCPFA